ncbi:MAG: twin-arginine translocation signal domain-containing protein [Chloroflexota bacterium]
MSDRSRKQLSRRDFLKIAGATTAAVPTLLGMNLLYDSRGELPGEHDPLVNSWSLEEHDNQSILVLCNDRGENQFGISLGEILRAEGINSFIIERLAEFNIDRLIHFDIVLLSEGALTQVQADKISRYVFEGGNLLAMSPDPQLLPILGLKDQKQNSALSYVIVDEKHELGAGTTPVSLQFHGNANDYLLDGARGIAWLCDKNGGERIHPAVSIHPYGDGWACAWAYDLAKSVVLTRQGSPEWIKQERDGFDGIRPSDLFCGWIDLDKIEIPQADEQQRLLVNILHFLSQGKRPLPRLWYFPGNAKSILVATSDAHQNPGWAMEALISHVEKHGGHISIYSMPPTYSIPYRAAQKVRWWLEDAKLMDEAYFPSLSRVARWRERGHEFGIHTLVEDGFEASWQKSWEWFTGVGYGPVPPTTRVHRILWDGWVESARLQAEYGFRMNLDFYHVGDAFKRKNGDWVYGHFNGSGLPMKFIDENGKVLNIYQQMTQLADDHLLNLHWGGSVKLPAAQAVEVSKSLLDHSVSGGYAAIGAIFHTDPFAVGESWAQQEAEWMDGTLEYAATNDIPIWSSEMWLNFVEARQGTTIENLSWRRQERKLMCTVRCRDPKYGSISLLIPMTHSGYRLSGAEINGRPIDYAVQAVGSLDYACISLTSDVSEVVVYYE